MSKPSPCRLRQGTRSLRHQRRDGEIRGARVFFGFYMGAQLGSVCIGVDFLRLNSTCMPPKPDKPIGSGRLGSVPIFFFSVMTLGLSLIFQKVIKFKKLLKKSLNYCVCQIDY